MLKHKLRAILVVVLIPETMSPLHVRSKVYKAFSCVEQSMKALFQVWSKVLIICSAHEKSNASFATYIFAKSSELIFNHFNF